MTDTNIYRDIAARTDGAFMLGVVGPVRRAAAVPAG